ncbi:hypothetical protein AGMMS50293_25920 [Spirochaetia bacterium]|nr:hypothetical protein AGMMS50293_25920 [Spirochaetia bacterium]
MGSYYYLASQLPYLIYGQTPPMSSAAFRDLARPLLGESDAALLDLVDFDPQPRKDREDGHSYADNAPASGSEFIDRWREWERSLRLNLARHRAIKSKREGAAPVEPPVFPADAAAAAVKAVVATESALEAEQLLDKARWSAIEVLQGNDYFDRNTIFAYLLKLILLERKASFKTEEGFAEYKSLYASILEDVEEGVLPVGEPK